MKDRKGGKEGIEVVILRNEEEIRREEKGT